VFSLNELSIPVTLALPMNDYSVPLPIDGLAIAMGNLEL
jgi:hypothetical protein